MAVISLSRENFDTTIMGNNCTIIDFWAPWCGPCRTFAPVFEKVSDKKEHSDIVFGKVNIDEQPELASEFNIRSIPSIMIFLREYVIFSEAGSRSETALEQLIKDAKKIDINEIRKQKESDK